MFKILLVEDQPHNLRLMEQVLQDIRPEPEIHTARSGEEAIEKTTKETYNMILMDLALPGVDGIEAAGHIRQVRDYADVPIIAISAHVPLKETRQCLRIFDAYITKPIDEELLWGVLEKWMGD